MSFLAVKLTSNGLSSHSVALVLALFGALTIPSRLAGGALAARYGNRAGAVVGLTTAGIAQLSIAAAQTPAVTITAVVLLGLAYEVVEPATQAIVIDDADPHSLAGNLSLLWAAISVAGVASGLLAAALSPLGIWALFVAYGVGSLAAALLARTTVPRSTPRHQEREGGGGWRAVCTRPLVIWTLVFTLYMTQVMTAVFMFPLAMDAVGLPSWAPGLAFATSATGAIGYHRCAGGAVNRGLDAAQLLTAGHITLAVGIGLWAQGTLPAYLIGALIEGAAGSVLTGTYQADAAQWSTSGATAQTMALFGLAWGIAAVAAPLAATPLLDTGPTVLWATVALCTCVSASLLTLRPTRTLALYGGPN